MSSGSPCQKRLGIHEAAAGGTATGKLHGPIEALPQGLDEPLALVGLVHSGGKRGGGDCVKAHDSTGDVFRLVEEGYQVARINNHKAVLLHATRKVSPHERQRVLVGLEDRYKGAVGNAGKADELPRVLALRGDAANQPSKRKSLWCGDVLVEALSHREAEPEVAVDHLGHPGLVRGAGEKHAPSADSATALPEAREHPPRKGDHGAVLLVPKDYDILAETWLCFVRGDQPHATGVCVSEVRHANGCKHRLRGSLTAHGDCLAAHPCSRDFGCRTLRDRCAFESGACCSGLARARTG